MKQLDAYYRALLKYREQTSANRDCVASRNAVAKANAEADKIVLTRKICTVNEDWVDAIEAGLEFIGKAIKEDRQFIRSNGEVVPIEKVKNVSKDSVTHLAKHSNLITRETDSEDIIPDQLYTVEKLNEYAIYENRFLYMLLCYLRDFITMRYNRILELSNTYNGSMVMNKTAKISRRTLCYEVKLTEERRDDPYLREHNQAKEILDRIDLLLKAVLSYLGTPLMELVSKAPMLKPPITKTNVLKMNNNFKQAMALYSFVVAYEGDGYSVETQTRVLGPFRDEIADEMAETILLSSFLTYEHSLGMEGQLKKSYELYEQKRKDEELLRLQEKIELLRRRLEKSGETPEEYILLLEKQIRTLEKRCEEMERTRLELSKTKLLLEQSNERVSDLTKNLQIACDELETQKQKYFVEIQELKLAHEEEVRRIQEEHTEEVQKLCQSHEEAIEALRLEHESELETLREQFSQELAQRDQLIEEQRERFREDAAAHAAELSRVNREHQAAIDELKGANVALEKKIDELTTEKRLLNAQLLGLRREHGLLTEEDQYRSRERFTELEHTFEEFKKFYKKEWAQTKKGIRKELLGSEKKNLQTENEKTDEEKS